MVKKGDMVSITGTSRNLLNREEPIIDSNRNTLMAILFFKHEYT